MAQGWNFLIEECVLDKVSHFVDCTVGVAFKRWVWFAAPTFQTALLNLLYYIRVMQILILTRHTVYFAG